jgi:hypothetical protein
VLIAPAYPNGFRNRRRLVLAVTTIGELKILDEPLWRQASPGAKRPLEMVGAEPCDTRDVLEGRLLLVVRDQEREGGVNRRVPGFAVFPDERVWILFSHRCQIELAARPRTSNALFRPPAYDGNPVLAAMEPRRRGDTDRTL